MSFSGGYQSTIVGGIARGGAVFITDIEPQNVADNVGGKVFSSDGNVLEQCMTSTQFVRVHILAITGFSNFRPTILVDGAILNLTQDEDQNVWTGSIDVDLQGKAVVTAIHEDGANHSVAIVNDSLPIISDGKFINGYPNGQSELKEDDQFSFEVSSPFDFVSIEFDDFGAAKPQTFNFAASNSETVSVQIADRGNTSQSFGVRLRIKNSNETFSEWFESDSLGSVDGVNIVVLNNVAPTIEFSSINYPQNQEALKNEETAVVVHSISDFDTVKYSSGGQLQIEASENYNPNKVVLRLAGDYNVETSNLTITATRAANDSSSQMQLVVKIAHIVPELMMITPIGRLISGGNAGTEIERHTIVIRSSQELIELPAIKAPMGQLIDSMAESSKPLEFEQAIEVHDNDLKGNYELQLLSAKNLAGLTVTAFKSTAVYVLGGFSRRVLQIEAFGNEALIGTAVTDVSKLIVSDKDQIPMSYKSNLEEGLLSYTITQPSIVLNPEGNLFHWNDSQAINNNTTGLATITMEEQS